MNKPPRKRSHVDICIVAPINIDNRRHGLVISRLARYVAKVMPERWRIATDQAPRERQPVTAINSSRWNWFHATKEFSISPISQLHPSRFWAILSKAYRCGYIFLDACPKMGDV
jgi:hypothetical protein